MGDEQLLMSIEGDTARITLNRPKVHNALSIHLSDRLVEATRTIAASTDVKFVVIRGAGASFCVGDDINEMCTFGATTSAGTARRERTE